MAKRMSFNFHGVPLPSTYWVVGRIDLRAYHRTATIELLCFESEEKRRAGAEAIEKKIIDVDYNKFVEKLSADMLNGEDNNPVKAAYEIASAFKDEPDAPKPFFADAEDV